LYDNAQKGLEECGQRYEPALQKDCSFAGLRHFHSRWSLDVSAPEEAARVQRRASSIGVVPSTASKHRESSASTWTPRSPSTGTTAGKAKFATGSWAPSRYSAQSGKFRRDVGGVRCVDSAEGVQRVA
jgi:hypothetical protein